MECKTEAGSEAGKEVWQEWREWREAWCEVGPHGGDVTCCALSPGGLLARCEQCNSL